MTEKTPFNKEKTNAAMKFALDIIQQLPKGDMEALEAHLTAVLVVTMGALWGTFGTEFATSFIEAQLNGMSGEPELWNPPATQ